MYQIIIFKILILILNLNSINSWLLVPETSPTRHQYIAGFGIPVSLPDHSVTVGYVFKAQYFLPSEIKHLKSPYIWFEGAEVKKRSANNEKLNLLNQNNSNYYYDQLTGNYVEQYNVEAIEIETKPLKLKINENFIKNNINDNINDSRRIFYKALEGILTHNNFNGQACILRMICETANAQFSYQSGIIGELLNVFLSPATSNENLSTIEDEYMRAEMLGKSNMDCNKIYNDCKNSILDIFTGVIN